MAGLEGQTFAGFEIISKLGQGGMGAVYKARQPLLERLAAIKVMAFELASDPDYVARFRREAGAAANLSHPNMVQVYTAGESDGTHYIAMEFVDGESLQQRLGRCGAMDPREALAVTTYVAWALQHAWDTARLIHRDIKPDNIFLSRSGEVKVGDLGLAKSVGGQTVELTSTGMMMGTPHYISPEQARGLKDIDFRTDIYSLGGTLYRMLTGRPPYEGDDAMAIMLRHVNDPPPAIFKVWPDCPIPLGRLVAKMLAKDRNARHQSYGELISDLQSVRDRLGATQAPQQGTAAGPAISTPTPATSAPAEARVEPGRVARDPRLPIGAAATVVAVLLVGGLLYTRFSKARDAGELLGMAEASKVGNAGKAPAASAGPVAGSEIAPRASDLAPATKDRPFVNSLGMKFVPMPGTKVLFSIWETRVRDFEVFVKESGYDWHEKPPFEQGPDHPAVMVSWDDVRAFCDWLSKKEGREYRLPTDEEWDAGVGPNKYPWGDAWPPPKTAANIAGEECKLGREDDPMYEVLAGYHDDHPRTAPVGSYRVNWVGLYDMGGNVRELCEDWYTEAIYAKHLAGGGYEFKSRELADVGMGDVRRVARGGQWSDGNSSLLMCSFRLPYLPGTRSRNLGFRCVVVASSP